MFNFVSSMWPLLLLTVLIVMAIVLRKKNTFFYWSARIVAILFIVFLAWESLDIASYKLNNFFVDNIVTSIPLLIILILAWKYELVSAIGFWLAGVFFLIYFEWEDFPMGIPALFNGTLFAISWLKKRKSE